MGADELAPSSPSTTRDAKVLDVIEQGLTRNTDFAGRRTAIAVIALERSAKELPPEFPLGLVPGPQGTYLGLCDRQMLLLHHATCGANPST